jgi:DNA-binding transcriptional MocR family regulator
VLLAVLRLTLGWDNTRGKIPLRKLHELTGIGISHISEAIQELIAAGFLRREKRTLEVIFTPAGNFPSGGTLLPADRKKQFPTTGTATPDPAHLDEQKPDLTERKTEHPHRKADGDHADDGGEATPERLAALAQVITAAQGTSFDSDAQRDSYICRNHAALADLTLYAPEDIAKGIMAVESQAHRLRYSWNPTHVARAIDEARGHEIEADDAQERFEELLSFFHQYDYENP